MESYAFFGGAGAAAGGAEWDGLEAGVEAPPEEDGPAAAGGGLEDLSFASLALAGEGGGGGGPAGGGGAFEVRAGRSPPPRPRRARSRPALPDSDLPSPVVEHDPRKPK